MLLPSGNPFKCHEEVLYFQLLIPPKRFDIFFPLTGGCSEGLGAFRFFFKPYRSRWLGGKALQAMMSTSTGDYFLTIDELGKFLNMDVDDLKPILSQGSRSRSDDDLFMRTCGIIMRKFQHKKTYCLLGCGNLVTLGREFCLELLATEPQPLFW